MWDAIFFPYGVSHSILLSATYSFDETNNEVIVPNDICMLDYQYSLAV